MNGATFVARGYSGDVRHLTSMITAAVQHKGFALVDVFSPCVTFNNDNGHDFFKERVRKLEDEEHNPADWQTACEKAMMWGDTIYTGLFFQKEAPTLDGSEPVLREGGPLAFRELGITPEQATRIIDRMM